MLTGHLVPPYRRLIKSLVKYLFQDQIVNFTQARFTCPKPTDRPLNVFYVHQTLINLGEFVSSTKHPKVISNSDEKQKSFIYNTFNGPSIQNTETFIFLNSEVNFPRALNIPSSLYQSMHILCRAPPAVPLTYSSINDLFPYIVESSRIFKITSCSTQRFF